MPFVPARVFMEDVGSFVRFNEVDGFNPVNRQKGLEVDHILFNNLRAKGYVYHSAATYLPVSYSGRKLVICL